MFKARHDERSSLANTIELEPVSEARLLYDAQGQRRRQRVPQKPITSVFQLRSKRAASDLPNPTFIDYHLVQDHPTKHEKQYDFQLRESVGDLDLTHLHYDRKQPRSHRVLRKRIADLTENNEEAQRTEIEAIQAVVNQSLLRATDLEKGYQPPIAAERASDRHRLPRLQLIRQDIMNRHRHNSKEQKQQLLERMGFYFLRNKGWEQLIHSKIERQKFGGCTNILQPQNQPESIQNDALYNTCENDTSRVNYSINNNNNNNNLALPATQGITGRAGLHKNSKNNQIQRETLQREIKNFRLAIQNERQYLERLYSSNPNTYRLEE